jgi:hypothetical protein
MSLSSCARAATAAETRYRIDKPIAPARAARIFALDDAAAAITRRVARQQWANAKFYVCEAGNSLDGSSNSNGHGRPSAADDVLLREIDGSSPPPASLQAELAGADVAVVIATQDGGRRSAAAIGRTCSAAGIMTAGIVLGDGSMADDAVAALRPYARVLLLSADESDVFELLTALRV